MKLISTLIITLLIVPTVLKAQKNFQPGYIVDLKGDTVKSFIDYREWKNNPVSVEVKTNYATTVNTAETIKAFGINKLEQFESYTVLVSQNRNDFNQGVNAVHLTGTKLDSGITQTVFLKKLFSGKAVTLYSYEDNIKVRYYVKQPTDQNPQELIYNISVDQNNTVSKINRFRIQLQYIGQQNNVSSTVSRQIASANYNEADLIKITKAINGNNGQATAANAEKASRLFVGAGINASTLTFSGDVLFPEGTKSNSLMPRVNIGIDWLRNNAVQTFFFRTELSLTANSFTFTDVALAPTSLGLPGQNRKASLQFKQYTIAVAPQIVYNFYNTERLKFFIDLGPALNFSTYNNYFYRVKYSDIPTKDQAGFPEFSKLWFSVVGKVGCTLNKKTEFNLGYIYNNTITNYAAHSAQLSTFSAGVNFFLDK